MMELELGLIESLVPKNVTEQKLADKLVANMAQPQLELFQFLPLEFSVSPVLDKCILSMNCYPLKDVCLRWSEYRV